MDIDLEFEQHLRGGKTRVFIVDDHPYTRLGLRAAFEQQADLTICGEAGGQLEALAAIAEAKPHVVTVDLTLQQGNGLDLIRDIHLRHPEVKVLVVSMRDEMVFAPRVLRAGAMGFVNKAEGIDRAIEAIRQVRRGNVFLSPDVAARLVSEGGPPGAEPDDSRRSLGLLSDRELEILELIGQGFSGPDIAKRLHVSAKTIEWHRENLKRKLEMASANELLRFAIRWVASQQL